MNKIYKILMVGAVATLLLSTTAIAPHTYGGHTPGFWKKWTCAWECAIPSGGGDPLDPDDPLADVFDISRFPELAGATLMDALKFHGGRGDLGMARNLLRQAVAALLNSMTTSCHPTWQYPFRIYHGRNIIPATNDVLDDGSRQDMEDLKDIFDDLNNLGEPDGGDDWFKC